MSTYKIEIQSQFELSAMSSSVPRFLLFFALCGLASTAVAQDVRADTPTESSVGTVGKDADPPDGSDGEPPATRWRGCEAGKRPGPG